MRRLAACHALLACASIVLSKPASAQNPFVGAPRSLAHRLVRTDAVADASPVTRRYRARPGEHCRAQNPLIERVSSFAGGSAACSHSFRTDPQFNKARKQCSSTRKPHFIGQCSVSFSPLCRLPHARPPHGSTWTRRPTRGSRSKSGLRGAVRETASPQHEGSAGARERWSTMHSSTTS